MGPRLHGEGSTEAADVAASVPWDSKCLTRNFQDHYAHIQNLKEMLDHLKLVTKHLCKYIIHGDILSTAEEVFV